MSSSMTMIQGLYGGDAKGLYRGNAYGGGSHRNMMIYRKKKPRWPKILIAIVVVLIVVGCVWQFACGGLPFFKNKSTEQTKEVAAITALKTYMGNIGKGATGTILISAIGDCTLGTDVNFDTSTNFDTKYESVGTTAYFFGNVSNILSKDDLTVCNFEGTLTSQGERQDKQFAFKGPAEYANILVDGSVESANLANNHSFDYGTVSYEDTKTNLTNANITNFGYDRVNTYEVDGVTIGLFGVCVLDDYSGAEDTMKQDIAALDAAGCDLIIGCFHWGEEGEHTVADSRVSLAHEAIDLGCDLVLGTHPHVLQGIEKYNNRYICYSLGNFCFGGNDNPSEYDTMIFQQAFTFRNGELILDETTINNIDVVPCSVSSSSDINDYRPTPLTGDSGNAVIARLNSYSALLSGSYVQFNETLNDEGSTTITGTDTTAVDAAGK